MPTKHHFTNEFKSIHGLDYKIEIWHKTTEVTDTTEIKSGAPGFTLNYKKLKDPILGGMMPSTLTFKFLVNNTTDLNNAHGILTAQNENFYIKVYRKGIDEPVVNYQLWWFGWVTSGFDGYSDRAFPYVLDVKATCSLGKQLNKYNNQVDVASQADYRDLSYPFQLFEDNYNINDMLPSSLFYSWAWQTNWWNQESGTPSESVNPIRKTFYNRAAFVSDPETFPLTINNYVDEIKGMLKSFMMRSMLSGGKYHIQQVRTLDQSSPDPIFSASADGTAGEITPDMVGYPTGISDEIVIDNTASPSDHDKANIKEGAKFSIREEAKSVRATYIFGNNFCTMPLGLDYTAGNIPLGFVSQGTSNLQLFLNVVLKQTFPLTGADAVSPVPYQGGHMTGVLNITLKIGNKYLTRQGGTTNPMDMIWSTDPSTIDFFTGEGTYYSNSLNNLYESQNAVQAALNQFGGDYPYPFTQWQNDNITGIASTTTRFYVPGITLPDLGSTFGQVEFKINEQATYNLFWTEFTQFVSPDTDLSDWITFYNPAASTNLNFDTSTGTPAASLSKSIELGVVPYLSDITANEETATDEEAAPQGAVYYASQSGNDQAPDIDLGDLPLGTNSSSNQINTLRAKDSDNNYINTGGFRDGNSGNYISTGQLLCNEYLKSKDEPVVTLSASIISTSYEAHRTINYEDTLGGTGARFVFGGGKFNPMEDTWSGIWYKLNLGNTPTEDNTPIYDYPQQDEALTDQKPSNNELGNHKIGFVLNNLIVATTNADITAGVTINKVDTLTTTNKVYDNQKLIIADKFLKNVTEVTANGEQNTGATQINFDSITPTTSYSKGSFLLLKPNDLSNVITAGTSTPNLYQGVTTTYIDLSPQEFDITSHSNLSTYTRDNLGSVQPSSFINRSKAYASCFIPLNYKATAVDIYASANRNIRVLTARITQDTTTLQGSGTSNTTLTLSTAWPSVAGEYIILEFEVGASTDEIRGAKITIQAV